MWMHDGKWWAWHEIKEASATSQTMEKYVQSYRKLCHSNWCSFELLWDNDYASIWIYILQKHTDSDWKCHHISLPLCRACSRLSHIITVCCHIDKICRVRMSGYVHIGECECGCVCVCDFFPRIPVCTYTKEQNSFSYRNILIANTLNSKLAKKSVLLSRIFCFISRAYRITHVWDYDCSELVCMNEALAIVHVYYIHVQLLTEFSSSCHCIIMPLFRLQLTNFE